MRENASHIPFSELVSVNPPPAGKLSGLVPYVGMADVTNEGRLARIVERPAAEISPGQPCFRDGDTLVAKITPCMENGKGAFVRGLNGATGAGSTEFHVLRPRPGVDPRFAYYCTRSRAFRLEAEAMMTGSAGQRRVPAAFFSRYAVPNRTLAEQQAAADIIDAVSAQERAIEASIAKLRSLRAGVLLRAFSAVEGGKVPDGWTRVALGNVVPRVEYGTSEALDRNRQGLPVLRMNNIHDGKPEVSDLRYVSVPVPARLELRYGDVLFNRTNSIDHIGKSGIWREELPRASFASYLVRVNPDPSLLIPEYLVEWLMHPVIRQRVRSISTVAVQQVNVNPSRLLELEIDMPIERETQRQIVESLHVLDEQINRERTELAKLRKVKLGTVDHLLAGNG
ncbi:restriction endonuclease subunit S [Streptomyces sp. CNQ-509]|uniref:restriction endonuclease subunit S n=1 Tax=Streptomyces sp. CNQ-509 TaxID=444103 RepID=UPI00099E11AC|nr:restriction endonuclease subunit S [Streptomyces sp. CNQ-509]